MQITIIQLTVQIGTLPLFILYKHHAYIHVNSLDDLMASHRSNVFEMWIRMRIRNPRDVEIDHKYEKQSNMNFWLLQNLHISELVYQCSIQDVATELLYRIMAGAPSIASLIKWNHRYDVWRTKGGSPLQCYCPKFIGWGTSIIKWTWIIFLVVN